MLKIDLHTHSTASPDGGIKLQDYAHVVETGQLDYLAITDHNTIDGALEVAGQLGKSVIIGEEIMTSEGEIIGLFMQTAINPGLSAAETARQIKAQGGLVYIPHPFETVRHGLSESSLNAIADLVDIVEVHNGRAVFQNRGPQAASWARTHNKAAAAGSDAHGRKGLGTTYTSVNQVPTADNLTALLERGRLTIGRPPLKTLLYPKAHRLRKKLRKA